MKRILLIFLVVLISSNMYGRIILPSIFADNMVLQQNSNVAIWGWSGPGETIKIVTSWSKDTVKVKSDNSSKWTASIKTIAAGGPYSIQILGNEKLQLNNVMLGEVWLCSGQSNMEMTANWKIINGDEEVANATNPNIRIFHIERIGAEYPQQNCIAKWSVCSPEAMRSSSALGYFFARELQQKLNVPVGILVSAWGGTPAEVWIEKSKIESNPELNKAKYTEHFDGWPSVAGTTYNSMIAPIVPYGIAGAIWYQGETNCGNYPIYSLLMKTLIESWRADFKKDFPFYYVQIAPFTYGANSKAEYLREQQDIASKTIPKTGMVVISDLVDNVKDIHPKNKLDVGKRLAAYALSETYKQNMGEYKSPSYESMKIEKDKIRISFSHAAEGLRSTGKTPGKFMIAGDDHKFVPGTAKIDGNTVLVSSKQIKSPMAVRFCFDDSTMPDIFSNYGLPVAPFRTDKW